MKVLDFFQMKSTHVNVKKRWELKGGGKGQRSIIVVLTIQENFQESISPWQVRTDQKLLLREVEHWGFVVVDVVGGGGGFVVVVMHTYTATSHEKANKCL